MCKQEDWSIACEKLKWNYYKTLGTKRYLPGTMKLNTSKAFLHNSYYIYFSWYRLLTHGAWFKCASLADVFDPLHKESNVSVHSILFWRCTCVSPADNSLQIPFAVEFTDKRSTTVTSTGIYASIVKTRTQHGAINLTRVCFGTTFS